MNRHPVLETDRLVLRRWKDSDREPFAAMSRDPEVMEFFPAPLSREESDAMVDRIEQKFEERGWSLFAVEEREGGKFTGFVGLNVPGYETPFTPCVEIGWRLARPFWGRGLATEAARAVLDFGFHQLDLHEIVSFTAVQNRRSQKLMERIGMTRDPENDFDHPMLEEGHWLRRHVLYRLRRDQDEVGWVI